MKVLVLGIKIEVVCKEVGSGVGCVWGLDGLDVVPAWGTAERSRGQTGRSGEIGLLWVYPNEFLKKEHHRKTSNRPKGEKGGVLINNNY